MLARFELASENTPVLVIEPTSHDESILLAAFLKYDANVLFLEVKRRDGRDIESVTLRAGSE